jgi:AcrR family transcriptional regulator
MRALARTPQQSRSRATLDRLLDATAALLAEKPFDEASVAEITRRARTSVGAFYGRFPDKESLLDCFDERFFELARASCDEFFDSPPWRAATLDGSVGQLISLLVANHRRHKGVLRALVQRGRSDSRVRARADRHNEYVLGRITLHLLSRPEPISAPRPARAVEMAFLFAVAAIREVVLFETSCGMAAPSDEEFAAELTRAFLAYLREDRPGPEHRPRSAIKRRGRGPSSRKTKKR